MEMPSNRPRKPRILLNFILAFLVIAFAFALDTYHKHLKAEAKAAEAQAAQDTAAHMRPAIADTAVTRVITGASHE
jgi:hypothetical protein